MALPMRTVTAFAPGRVNLIGEHTDYNGGLALPFAIGEGVTVRALVAAEPRIDVVALDLGEKDSFALDEIEPAAGWRGFARGMVAELIERGHEMMGGRLDIAGTVPRGGGLGSSAALAVSLGLALTALADLSGRKRVELAARVERGTLSAHERIELAKLCSRVENVWVGARSGLLDQLAALFGERNCAIAIDFDSLDLRLVPVALEDHRLVLLDSREQHVNAASGYNQRRAECDEACALLGLRSLREARPNDVPRLPAPLADRVRHVIDENERVLGAIEALERRDWGALGRLLDASHRSSRDLYALSTPAVETAVGRLLGAGALGARVVGGGFGGHVLGLMPPGAEAPAGAFEVVPSAGAGLRRAE
jgi:galactokinase